MRAIRIDRASPLSTVQDAGRTGMLRHGISTSGPMDRAGFARAGAWIGGAGAAGIEFTTAGIAFTVLGGSVGAGFDGGDFRLSVNGRRRPWPARIVLRDGDVVAIAPGAHGNYGYARFSRTIVLPAVMASVATNSVAKLGGIDGRSLQKGDVLAFGDEVPHDAGDHPRSSPPAAGPIRILWGLHADLFAPQVRERFVSEPLVISARIDRMGARLNDAAGVFSGPQPLSLVSDAIVPGDIQILGDGTPIVLLRDHQPTGGYPRIATISSADIDRFAQLRPGMEVRFAPVTLEKAHAMLPST